MNPSAPMNAVLDELAGKIAGAETRERSNGWRHAALIVRLFSKSPRRIVRQLRQHAKFFAESVPDKAAAYREAQAMVTLHTGESPPVPAGELFAPA